MNLNEVVEIYVRLLEGGEVLVPVKAVCIEANLFRIIENQYIDQEDATSIWEFFPDEIVECELKDDIWIAKKLIESSMPDRNLYRLIFRIVESAGNIEIKESDEMRESSKELFKRDDIIQKQHPTVKRWMDKHETVVS